MRKEDIEPDEQYLPPEFMWYQRKGCLFFLFILVLVVVGGAIFVWQVRDYYKAIKTGELTPEMQELVQEITGSDNQTELVSKDDDPSFGSEDAKIKIIAFEDFQCPYCKEFFPIFNKLKQEYKDDIFFVYRDFPTDHEFSQKAAEAGECADEQGNFWGYHDLLFENSENITSEDILVNLATQANLDSASFKECLDSNKYASEVKKDFTDGALAGVNGTPTFFINGYKIEGSYPEEFWRQTFSYILGEE